MKNNDKIIDDILDDTEPKFEKAKDYSIIRISEKTRSDDLDYVALHCGGDGITWSGRLKRGEAVPVPNIVVNALKDAKHPLYEESKAHMNGMIHERRKVVRFIPRFTFEMIRKIGTEEYNKLKRLVLQRGSGLTDDEAYGG